MAICDFSIFSLNINELRYGMHRALRFLFNFNIEKVMTRFTFHVALATAVFTCTLTAHAAVALAPLSAVVAGSGGGLTGNWFKVKDDARISNVSYNDGTTTQAIKDFGWGTGIWSVLDLTAATDSSNGWVTATATTTSAVSFANNIYNNSVASYGSWVEDRDRTLVPVTMGDTNFVAMFSGYLYVAQAGVFDFGVFGDDGFSFTLTGLGTSTAPLVKSSVVNSPGRELLEMQDVSLQAGFYGISLDFFNRLEAGVIDLVWRPAGGEWDTIDSSVLYAQLPGDGVTSNGVPEPGSLMLVVLAMASLFALRRSTVSR